jgi:hypothetical protein
MPKVRNDLRLRIADPVLRNTLLNASSITTSILSRVFGLLSFLAVQGILTYH